MSKTTAVNAIPYPEDTDAPDGPTQIKALAELLDTLKWGSRNLKPTVGELPMTAESLVLEESYADIEGCKLEITPAVASKLKVVGFYDVSMIEAEAEFFGSVKIDSEAEKTPVARYHAMTTGSRATVCMAWVLSLTAAAHTIKLRAKRNSAKKATVFKSGTQMIYELVAS